MIVLVPIGNVDEAILEVLLYERLGDAVTAALPPWSWRNKVGR